MSRVPTDITLKQTSKVLVVAFEDVTFELPCEYLRTFSPSAEVQGHGPGQEVLQTHKENVNIVSIEPVGYYAVRLNFDDGHNSGLFTWNYLYELGENRAANWQRYLAQLESAGVERTPQPNDTLMGT